jgi:hypothetical protein
MLEGKDTVLKLKSTSTESSTLNLASSVLAYNDDNVLTIKVNKNPNLMEGTRGLKIYIESDRSSTLGVSIGTGLTFSLEGNLMIYEDDINHIIENKLRNLGLLNE